jgi:pathogenesis-related protein 1
MYSFACDKIIDLIYGVAMPNYPHFIITSIIFGVFCFPTTLFAEKLTVQQQQQIVDAHNRYRKQVHVNELKWSDELASVAQQWVLRLRNEHQCNMHHSNILGVGENLFWASAVYVSNGSTYPQSITPREVVEAWGSEKDNYHDEDNSCDSGKVCGHYTQLVWHNTTKVGCAMTVCPDYSQIWSCNYSPPGNFSGEKPY